MLQGKMDKWFIEISHELVRFMQAQDIEVFVIYDDDTESLYEDTEIPVRTDVVYAVERDQIQGELKC